MRQNARPRARPKTAQKSRGATPRPPQTLSQRFESMQSSRVALRPLTTSPMPPVRTGQVRSAGANAETVYDRSEVFDTLGPTDNDKVTSFQLSPVNAVMFPWVSTITPLYSYFAFDACEVRYEPYCATTTSGRIVMAFLTDAEDVPSYGVSDLTNFMSAVVGSVREPFVMRIPLRSFALPRYSLYTSGVATYTRLSSPGQLLVGVQGGTTGISAYGTLRVVYRLRLIAPQSPERPVARHSAFMSQALTSTATSAQLRIAVAPDLLGSESNWLTLDATTGCYVPLPKVRRLSVVVLAKSPPAEYAWQAETYVTGSGGQYKADTTSFILEENGGSVSVQNFDQFISDGEDQPANYKGFLSSHLRFTLSATNVLGFWLGWNTTVNKHGNAAVPFYIWIYEW